MRRSISRAGRTSLARTASLSGRNDADGHHVGRGRADGGSLPALHGRRRAVGGAFACGPVDSDGRADGDILAYALSMSAFEVLIAAVMVVGLAGTVLPLLPGVGLIMGATLVWAIVGDAGFFGWAVAVVIVAIGVVGMVVAAALPAKRSADAGAPWWVLAVGAAGVVVGFFVIPVVGALVGGPAALYVAELIRLRDARRAWHSTAEALKGVGLGIGVQLAAGLAMVAIWGVAVLAR
jgi:uncharacterized protein YqgC (DUF456 family)